MEQTQVVLSPHPQHFQNHRQTGELSRADLQSYHHIWDFHCDFLNPHRPEEGLQKPTFTYITKVLPSLGRAGTENTGNASRKNHLKCLKYLKANVTNKDIHPLQGFGQYAVLGTCPLFPGRSGEKDQQHNQISVFKYHLCGQ